MEEDEPHSPPLSLKQKLKHSLCFSCCFRRRHHPDLLYLKPDRPQKHHSDEFKDKCKAILGRVNKHRRHSSTEFRYDPLSYSLNFEDGVGDDRFDEAPLKSFAARLPHSPPSQPREVGIREIAAVN